MQLVSLLIKKLWPLWLNMEIRYAVRDHYIHIDPSQCLLSIRSGWKAWIHGNDKYLAFAVNLSDCHDFSQMLHFGSNFTDFLHSTLQFLPQTAIYVTIWSPDTYLLTASPVTLYALHLMQTGLMDYALVACNANNLTVWCLALGHINIRLMFVT